MTRAFYAVRLDRHGAEPLGSGGKMIMRDLKTERGARSRVLARKWGTWRLYSFINFYDNSTWRLIETLALGAPKGLYLCPETGATIWEAA
jgi:hypothetical protein